MAEDRYLEDNLANWNDRVPIHAGPDGYGVDDFVSDTGLLSDVVAFDLRYVGNVADRTLLHPQCHIGTDTLSWAKLGAQVTGFDFSPAAIGVARDLSDRLKIDATFVETELYASPNVIDQTFDIVYTGVGAVNWLPDIDRWAQVMASFTRRGGTFYMREGHPALWSLADERTDGRLVVEYPYFERAEPMTWDESETYAGSGIVEHSTMHEWNHGLGEIVTSLVKAGFQIDLLEEHKFIEWEALPWMEKLGASYVLPEHQRDNLPLMYSILATRR